MKYEVSYTRIISAVDEAAAKKAFRDMVNSALWDPAIDKLRGLDYSQLVELEDRYKVHVEYNDRDVLHLESSGIDASTITAMEKSGNMKLVSIYPQDDKILRLIFNFEDVE